MFETYKDITNSIVGMVNRVRTPNKRTLNALAPKTSRADFVEAVQYVADKPFLLAPLAEASFRFSESRMMAVRPDVHFRGFKDEGIGLYALNVDMSFNNAPPIRHFDLHKDIYQASPAIHAILLCHPINAFKCWQHNIIPSFEAMPGLENKLGGYTVANEATVLNKIEENRLVLVPGLGLLSLSEDLLSAVYQVELLEWICALALE